MKVTISVGGRFHAFNLAEQLSKRGLLDVLITSYPGYIVERFGIPRSKTRSILIKEILQRSGKYIPAFVRSKLNYQYFTHEIFDTIASRKIKKSDIFVGWSSFCLKSLRKAKECGALTVIDHGSAHPIFQERILSEEYEMCGIKFYKTHEKLLSKALDEYNEADYIAIPSIYSKKTFLDNNIPEEKLLHVPYGVSLAEFKELPKSDNIFRVVFAGGISIRKGVHYLLKAFSELNLPNSELILVGTVEPEMSTFLKKYEGHYKLIGHVNQKTLHEYYSNSSVFVLNSIEEGFGMVIIQAMACGLPVIATINTGGPDIINDGVEGFIIPIRDVEKLKEKLSYLYENQDICKQMGQSAKERVSSGFTWDDYGDRMVREYERILAGHNK
ncbi:MAG: glycosyltransferase family 4 protein [Candidatus Jorgensenbacteria bacterium]|nr:glycosyltransferase family 4 protein [Candidatus Jorgensenbacteria bacterium]